MSWLDDLLASEWTPPAALGLGLAGNIPAILSQMKAAEEERRIRDILTNPAKFAAFAQGMPSFITSDLTNSVAGAVRADLAQRGLSDAPGFTAKSIGGAMAPYVAQDVANRFSLAQANLTGAPKMPQFPGFNPAALLGILKQLQEMRTKQKEAQQKNQGAAGGEFRSPAESPLFSLGVPELTFDPSMMAMQEMAPGFQLPGAGTEYGQ